MGIPLTHVKFCWTVSPRRITSAHRKTWPRAQLNASSRLWECQGARPVLGSRAQRASKGYPFGPLSQDAVKFDTVRLILCLGTLNTVIAFAGPADYVYTPTVEYGEREIDFKHGNAKQQDGTRKQVSSLGFGYGATEYWFTEIYLKHESEGTHNLNIAEWENKFQLTETGKYPVDVGLIAEFEAPLNNSTGQC